MPRSQERKIAYEYRQKYTGPVMRAPMVVVVLGGHDSDPDGRLNETGPLAQRTPPTKR